MVRLKHLARAVAEFNYTPTEPKSNSAYEFVSQLNESGNLSPSVISTIVLTLRTEYNRTGVLKLLWIVVLLQEYNLRLNAVPIDTNDRIRLANAHFEIWMRSGVSAHISHLESAIEHFKSAFATGFRQEWLNDYLVYFKALQMIGDHEAAEDLIKGLLPWYENQACYPNILFYAGVAHKASKKLDAANGYFFEASQLGPPKLFSKLEMMVIISRIIEEGGGDDDGNDEAYRMVHAHLAMEGHISSQVDYDDWISDGKTWLNLADKCSLHHMFSLAADFYALAITRDFDAFRKPMLWYRFAKSCRMCGRIADAQLAVKQALTRMPYCRQLQNAYEFWRERPWPMQEYFGKESSALIALIPLRETAAMKSIRKLQAIARGKVARIHWLRGIGKRKTLAKRADCRLSFLGLDGIPLSMGVRASWSGTVSQIEVFDHRSDSSSWVELLPPFSPILRSGLPQQLQLVLSNVDEHPDQIQDDHQSRWMTMQLKFVYEGKQSRFSSRLIQLVRSGDNGWRLVNGWPSMPQLSATEVGNLRDAILNDQPLPAISGQSTSHIISSFASYEVARFGLLWSDEYFFVKIVNRNQLSQIVYWHPRSEFTLKFCFLREHFDRSMNVVAIARRLLMALDSHGKLRGFIPRGRVGTTQWLPGRSMAEHSFDDKCFFVLHLPSGHGFQITIIDVHNRPIFSDFFESLSIQDDDVEPEPRETVNAECRVLPTIAEAVPVLPAEEEPVRETIAEHAKDTEIVVVLDDDVVESKQEVNAAIVEESMVAEALGEIVSDDLTVPAPTVLKEEEVLATSSNMGNDNSAKFTMEEMDGVLPSLVDRHIQSLVDAICCDVAKDVHRAATNLLRLQNLIEESSAKVLEATIEQEINAVVDSRVASTRWMHSILDDVLARSWRIIRKKEISKPKLTDALLTVKKVPEAQIGLSNDEEDDLDGQDASTTRPVYHKILSQHPGDHPLHTHNLMALLKRTVKRQPVHSSLASVIHPPARPVEDIPIAELTKPAAEDDLLGGGRMASPLFLPEIRNKPKLHKSPKKPKKILFSSSFNPLQENDDEGSVGVSLSSTSWSNGRFSIERSIQSGETSGLHLRRSKTDDSSQLSMERELVSKYGDQEDGLLIQSVKNVQRLGYVPTMETRGSRPQRRPWAYAAYWQRLIIEFLTSHEQDKAAGAPRPPFYVLKKQLRVLRKTLMLSIGLSSSSSKSVARHGLLSVEEMICALAETRSSIGEILLRLNDPNMSFLSEIQLACGSLNVRAIVGSFPGGTDLLEAFDSHSIDALSHASQRPDELVLSPVEDNAAGSPADDDYSSVSTMPSASSPTGLAKPPITLKLFRPGSLPCLRDASASSHLVYPHLALAVASPVVLNRGASIRLSPMKGQVYFSEESELLSPPKAGGGGLRHMSSSNSLGSISDSGSLEPKKSFRVHSQIVTDLFDEFSDVPVVVMARKDALRAQQEEVVLKSNKQYIKDPIRKRMQIQGKDV